MSRPYEDLPLSRAEVERTPGHLVLDFGTNWCGYCNAARTHVDEALAAWPGLRHVRVEDGRGRRLGRSFRVKLWPTLVFMRDGQEVARVVRPGDTAQIRAALMQLEAE